ncbi:MAG: LPS export ABC transporter periplasmic protein LptC [Tannerellaceae bacterium]|nr:LPS export ABC transporter periplasmic protein LptC [Tannerellaceae bacterium]
MLKARFLCKTNHKGIATIFGIVVMLLLFSASCKKEITEVVAVEFDPNTTYTMKATEVSSLISDSGVTRYRMVAQEWRVYGKADEPFWYFPEGIYLEKFDSLFTAEATIQADTAYYYEKLSLWKLIDNVEIENLEGEFFETSLLFWDQKEEKIYSGQFIRIVQKDEKIITGIGFESNQEMSQYIVYNSRGEFPVSETPVDFAARDSMRQPVPVQVSPVTVPEPPEPETILPDTLNTE